MINSIFKRGFVNFLGVEGIWWNTFNFICLCSLKERLITDFRYLITLQHP
mgnify:CR=1 FL=1